MRRGIRRAAPLPTSSLGPDGLEVQPRALRIGGAWCRSFAVVGYPREVGRGWLDEVVPSRARQLGLFGELSDADERAIRGLDRLRGLLGPDAVFIASVRGGRGPSDRVQLIPWGEPIPSSHIEGPWPGRHPHPSPALIYPRPIRAVVRAEDGTTLRVLADGRFSGTPASLSVSADRVLRITEWSAPWLLDEQFWDVDAHRRRARCQLLLEDQRALLAFVEGGDWFVEAEYD